jgi:hypothetical protein
VIVVVVEVDVVVIVVAVGVVALDVVFGGFVGGVVGRSAV